jgi:hypothetical protein
LNGMNDERRKIMKKPKKKEKGKRWKKKEQSR